MGDNNNNNINVNLPPGFRFYPTDEELVVHFLHRKASLLPCHPDVIPDLDLYPFDPWELHGRALSEGNQWYYYSRRIQERITSNGYWVPIGMEEAVVTSSGNKRVGIKKYYVFYVGGGDINGTATATATATATGTKTNWIMQEYRLPDSANSSSTRSSSSSKRKSQPKTDHSKLVICRVYEHDDDEDGDGTELSCLDEVFLSLDDLEEVSLPN